ncbi:MAG: tetraacyldisaccharide 4'-kinase [Candidatus Omnitrophica bacterium]|nr:tetraacyldisaccharide 4'-kinase [Candidatus Omnitrophota bacterium]
MSKLLERIWYGPPSNWLKPLEAALALASHGYAWGMHRDQARKVSRARRLPRPVISVGNLTVGGTGKTPVIQFLADQGRELGYKAAILMRGYGAEGETVRRVKADVGGWKDFGDEAALLATQLPESPVWVGRDRFEVGEVAVQEDPSIDLFLLDDGFQHRQLHRDFDLVLVDAHRGLGNGALLPLGPLREPAPALGRADRIGVVYKVEGEGGWSPPDSVAAKCFRIDLGPVGWNELGSEEVHPLEDLPRDCAAYAVAAIGSPQSFEGTLESLGIRIEGRSYFRDHHPFTDEEVRKIEKDCTDRGLRAFTTAKDAVRLASLSLVWTEGRRPIIIQLGLKSGDGGILLKEILNSVLKRTSSDEIKISGGGRRHDFNH